MSCDSQSKPYLTNSVTLVQPQPRKLLPKAFSGPSPPGSKSTETMKSHNEDLGASSCRGEASLAYHKGVKSMAVPSSAPLSRVRVMERLSADWPEVEQLEAERMIYSQYRRDYESYRDTLQANFEKQKATAKKYFKWRANLDVATSRRKSKSIAPYPWDPSSWASEENKATYEFVALARELDLYLALGEAQEERQEAEGELKEAHEWLKTAEEELEGLQQQLEIEKEIRKDLEKQLGQWQDRFWKTIKR